MKNYFFSWFGNSSTDVATTLMIYNFKGIPGDPTHCPLATAISELMVPLHVAINSRAIWNYETSELICPMPEPLIKFVNDFDEGAYPELDINEDMLHTEYKPQYFSW